MHAVIATAKAVDDHSGGTAFESVGNLGLKIKNGSTWFDKTISPVLFGSVVRPIIGLAQLNCAAALQPRRYPVGCLHFIMVSELSCT